MSHPEPRLPSPDVRWAMDAFVVSGNLLFGYGWCACDAMVPAGVALEIEYVNGRTAQIPASSGLDRGDVAARYPELPGNCGFLVYAVVGPQRMRAAILSLSDVSGREIARIPLPELLAEATDRMGGATSWPHVWRHLIRKVWRHVRQGNFAFLREHVVRLLPKLLSGRRRPDALARLIESLSTDAVLIVDHDLGGGANIFRDRLIEKLSAEGRTVALLTFIPPVLSHHLKVMRPAAQSVELRVSADWWLTLAASRKFSTVYFNNCVSHPDPERMPDVLLHFRRASGARLVMFMHDFHAICPSHFLLNRDGHYCGVPGIEHCRACLPAIEDNLAALYVARDIDAWRAAWLSCLAAADEVICFAVSGRDLLLRAYPALAAREISIRPHEVHPLGNHYRYPGAGEPLTIAVVGMINLHKGSQVVLDLAAEIERRDLSVRICIVGTLNAVGRSKVITQTGRYRPEALPDLLVRNGVHLALMPSIWPETFSFVTHELISAGVPLMAFDLGAQGDAVRAYRFGRVVPMQPAVRLIEEIMAFRGCMDMALCAPEGGR